MSNERNVRARRAEDTVMSVKAETLVVGDLPNLKTSVENQQKRSIVMLTKESDKDMPVCFSKSIINALIVLLAVLSCFSLAASVYILYDIFSIKYYIALKLNYIPTLEIEESKLKSPREENQFHLTNLLFP
jgi:hypothetical protein